MDNWELKDGQLLRLVLIGAASIAFHLAYGGGLLMFFMWMWLTSPDFY